MLRKRRRAIFLRLLVGLGLAAFATSIAAKDKAFVRPVAQPAKAYPAHDDHATEKVAIAADPYDTPEKAKIFSIDYRAHGLLPVFFVVTNDGSQPVAIANIAVTLITANRSKLTPLSQEDIYRRLSNPQTTGATVPLPLPIPQKKVKGTLSKKEMDEIDQAQFEARAVEPHSTQSGFFFFDIEDIASPLAGSQIDVTGVDDAKGNELMYFEIEMDKSKGDAQKQ